MSANDTGSTANETDNTTTFTFDNSIPIQSYLIAIAVGDLAE
jgi:aminopeptidase N